MPKETIKCPKCGTQIEISQIISHEIEVELQKKYENKMQEWQKGESEKIRTEAFKEADELSCKKIEQLTKQLQERDKEKSELQAYETELRNKEERLKAREQKIIDEYATREEEIRKRFEIEKKVIEERANKEAQESTKLEMQDLRAQLKEKEDMLEKAGQKELELRKAKRELEQEKKDMEIEIMRRMDEERHQIEDKAKRETEEAHKLKDREKDKQLDDMRNEIEELRRKAEQGSQKIQGEVMELELEEILKCEFPFDEIDPVSSGVKGGDIIQTVKTQAGHTCGKILWESKRTKNWSDAWIQKLKDDQRRAKADLAVIVSEALPKGFHHFRQIETVWVADLPSAVSLGLVLRTMLIQVAKTRELQVGKEEKMEAVYNYLTGPEFRNRVQAIMEGFIAMKRDLDSEKRAMENIWAKREKQIGRVVSNIAGMRGDLEGVVGAVLPSIKLLELPESEE